MEHVQTDSTMFFKRVEEDTVTKIRKEAQPEPETPQRSRGREIMGGNVVAYDC